MNKLDSNDFKAVYKAFLDKTAYEKAVSERAQRPFLALLFSRPPKDPAKNLSSSDLRELLTVTFRAAHPEFADRAIPGNGRLDAYTGSCRIDIDSKNGNKPVLVFSVVDNLLHCGVEERYEYDPGYGFIPQYQHDADPKVNQKNRNFAVKCIHDNRRGVCANLDPVFDSFDQFCRSETGLFPFADSLSVGERVQKARNYSFEHSSEVHQYLNDSLIYGHGGMKGNLNKDLKTFALVNCERRALYNDVVSGKLENKPLFRKRMETMDNFLKGFSDTQVYDLARHGLSDSSFKLDDILALSKYETSLRLEDKDLKSHPELSMDLYSKFAEKAFDCGYSHADILEKIRDDAVFSGLRGLSEDQMNRVYSNRATEYRKEVERSFDSLDVRKSYFDFSIGTTPAEYTNVPKPWNHVESEMLQMRSQNAVLMFVRENCADLKPEGRIELGDLYKMSSDIGEKLYELRSKGLPVPVFDVFIKSRSLGMNALNEGYNTAFGNAAIRKLENDNVSLHMSGNSADMNPYKNVFYDQVADTVSFLAETGKPAVLGSFLKDCNVNPDLSSYGHLGQALQESASRMMKYSPSIEKVRDKWSTVMQEGHRHFMKKTFSKKESVDKKHNVVPKF